MTAMATPALAPSESENSLGALAGTAEGVAVAVAVPAEGVTEGVGALEGGMEGDGDGSTPDVCTHSNSNRHTCMILHRQHIWASEG